MKYERALQFYIREVLYPKLIKYFALSHSLSLFYLSPFLSFFFSFALITFILNFLFFFLSYFLSFAFSLPNSSLILFISFTCSPSPLSLILVLLLSLESSLYLPLLILSNSFAVLPFQLFFLLFFHSISL